MGATIGIVREADEKETRMPLEPEIIGK